jgi:hypothetical protein
MTSTQSKTSAELGLTGVAVDLGRLSSVKADVDRFRFREDIQS